MSHPKSNGRKPRTPALKEPAVNGIESADAASLDERLALKWFGSHFQYNPVEAALAIAVCRSPASFDGNANNSLTMLGELESLAAVLMRISKVAPTFEAFGGALKATNLAAESLISAWFLSADYEMISAKLPRARGLLDAKVRRRHEVTCVLRWVRIVTKTSATPETAALAAIMLKVDLPCKKPDCFQQRKNAWQKHTAHPPPEIGAGY